MARRSTPRAKTDDLAFPVRVKLRVPPRGLGALLDRLYVWLNREVGSLNYAHHSIPGLGTPATAFYFRDPAAAQAFLAAFPEIELADGTVSIAYSRPAEPVGWTSGDVLGVCNLYSMTRSQDAIRALFKVSNDRTGNLASLPAIFPDSAAPVIVGGDESRTLAMMRWGMPSPAFALKNRKTDRGVTNIRNTRSPHWRRWLGTAHRCLVPVTSFSEYAHTAGQPPEPVWFALNEDRPLAAFAGLWTRWTSVRTLKDGETTDDLFGFLTTEANAEVRAIHPKAMPVILTEPDEWETWLTAGIDDAMRLQGPLPNGALKIVARGERSDGGS